MTDFSKEQNCSIVQFNNARAVIIVSGASIIIFDSIKTKISQWWKSITQLAATLERTHKSKRYQLQRRSYHNIIRSFACLLV